MPTFIVTAPDGKKLRVTAPEGATQEQAVAMARRQYKPMGRGSRIPGADALMAADIGRGVPFMNEIGSALYAPIGAALDASRGKGFDLGRAYDASMRRRADIEAYDDENHPIASGVGKIAGGVGSSLMVPGATSAKLLPSLASSAGYGALEGASSNREDRIDGALRGALWGAAGDLAGRGIAKVGGKLLKGATRDADAAMLRQKGVKTTIGQELGGRAKAVEDRLSGLPVVGGPIRDARRAGNTSLMRVAGNEALQDIGGSVAAGTVTGRAIADDVLAQADDAYSAALRGIQAPVDNQFSSALSSARQNPAIAELVDDEILPRVQNGVLDGVSMQEIKEVLDGEIRAYARVPGQRRVASQLRALRNEVLGLADRSGGGAAYKAARSSYGKAKTIARASAKSTSDGIATPRQLGQAIREGSRRFGPADAYARGLAPMQELSDAAARVMPSTIPDPGTAGQLTAMGLLTNPFKNTPAAIGAAGAGALYTDPGQEALRRLIIERPDIARQLGLLVDQFAAPAGLLGAVAGAQSVGQ